ncbi:MAG: hypothetical protein K6A42_01065 [Treponema sp.]|nr:hypothetical protein [Treponema sp.]
MNQDNCVLSYGFSCKEIKALADFFRDRQQDIPRELFFFSKAVKDKMYECMTIDEVEQKVKNEIC